jgi:hypothetical protein
MAEYAGSFEKFEGARKAAYLDLLSKGYGKTLAAHHVGVSHAIVCAYRKEFPEFKDEETEAQMNANGQVEAALFNEAIGGDVSACREWLHNRDPENWQDRRKLFHAAGLPEQPTGALPAEAKPEEIDSSIRELIAYKPPEDAPSESPSLPPGITLNGEHNGERNGTSG